MMPMFSNYTVKIDILNKPMLDIYVILSWVDDNFSNIIYISPAVEKMKIMR